MSETVENISSVKESLMSGMSFGKKLWPEKQSIGLKMKLLHFNLQRRNSEVRDGCLLLYWDPALGNRIPTCAGSGEL